MHNDEDLKKDREKDKYDIESMKMSEMPFELNHYESIIKQESNAGLMMDVMANISQNTTTITDHESMVNEDNMDVEGGVEAVFEAGSSACFNIAATESDDDGDGDDEDGGEGVPSAPKNKDKTKWSEEEVGWIYIYIYIYMYMYIYLYPYIYI
jgi:hypothetical protein